MKAVPLLLAAILAPAFASPASAQDAKWQLDAGHSTAVVSLVSSTHPSEVLNYGVELVGGFVSLDAPNFSKLSFTLNIFPAGEAPKLLNPDGTLRAGGLALLARYTLFTFTSSKPAVRGSDGKLRLAGGLTITHVVRESVPDWSVSYGGSTAIPPEINIFARDVILILDKPASELEYGWKVGWMEIKGLGTLALEDAPNLRAWLADSVWPAAVLDRNCYTPSYSISMRDYRGTICTGKLVTTEKPKELPSSGSTTDYSGARYAIPEHLNQLRLSLDLKIREPR